MRGLFKAIVLSATTALVCAPSVARADGFVNPWAGVNFGSNISNSRGGFGVNVGGMGAGAVGGEVAFGYNPSFFGTSGDFGHNTELVNLTWPSLRAQLDAGKAKCLAIFAPEQVSTHKVPTFKELGYDVVTTSDYVVYAPKNMPAGVRSTLVKAVKASVNDPDFISALTKQNIVVRYADGKSTSKHFMEIYNNLKAAKSK